MFESVIKAAMSFFHQNTSGRILNRFSKDLGQVDELLPAAFIDTMQVIQQLSLNRVVLVNFKKNDRSLQYSDDPKLGGSDLRCLLCQRMVLNSSSRHDHGFLFFEAILFKN